MPRLLADLLTEARPDPKKAFDFAQDVTKQLITLSTGTIALTITFLHDLAANASTSAVHWLEASWIAYAISVVFGLMTLLQLAGNLETADSLSIYTFGIKWASRLQIAAFIVALGLTVVFGVKAHDIHVSS